MKQIIIPYQPRQPQLEIHNSLKKKNVIVAHRRMGKTTCLLNELIKRAITTTKGDARFYYIAPFLSQAKAIAWDFLKYYTQNIPAIKINETELRIDFPNGSRIRLFGADNAEALRGLYIDGVVLDEYGDIKPTFYSSVILPAIMGRDSFVVFCGTPKGDNDFKEKYDLAIDKEDWFCKVYKASETGLLSPEELIDAKIQMGNNDLYQQEFECDFYGSIHGAYYADYIKQAETENRIGIYGYDPALPVHTFWDIGVGDATAIVFAQQYAKEIRIIDHYENNGEALTHYIQVLQSKNYVYGKHFAPHDIEVREFSSGKSRLEIAKELGINFDITPKISVDDGINAARTILPRCYFNKPKCDLLLKCLKNYKKEWDDKRQVFKSYPLHDWASDSADSFRYMAVNIDKIGRNNGGMNMQNYINEL